MSTPLLPKRNPTNHMTMPRHQPLPTEDLDEELDALDIDSNPFADVGERQQGELLPNNSNERESFGPAATNASHDPRQHEYNDNDNDSSSSSQQFILVATVVMGVLLAFVFSSSWVLYVLLILFLGSCLAAVLTRPSLETFHAKQEIRKILQRQQQQQDTTTHPNPTKKKTRNWFQRKSKQVQTFLTTEATQAVGGYDDLQVLDCGVGILIVARDLTNGQHYYTWMGIFGQWYSLCEYLSVDTQGALHQRLWQRSRTGTTTGRTNDIV